MDQRTHFHAELQNLEQAIHEIGDRAYALIGKSVRALVDGDVDLASEVKAGDEVIKIPPSLLSSALSVIDDASTLISMDLKAAGNRLANTARCTVNNRHLSFQIHLVHERSPINLRRNRRMPAIQRSWSSALRWTGQPHLVSQLAQYFLPLPAILECSFQSVPMCARPKQHAPGWPRR